MPVLATGCSWMVHGSQTLFRTRGQASAGNPGDSPRGSTLALPPRPACAGLGMSQSVLAMCADRAGRTRQGPAFPFRAAMRVSRDPLHGDSKIHHRLSLNHRSHGEMQRSSASHPRAPCARSFPCGGTPSGYTTSSEHREIASQRICSLESRSEPPRLAAALGRELFRAGLAVSEATWPRTLGDAHDSARLVHATGATLSPG